MPIFWLDTRQDPAVEMLPTDVLSVGYVAAGTNLAFDFTAKAWRADGADVLRPMTKAGPPSIGTLWTASIASPPRPPSGQIGVFITHSRFGVIFLDETAIRPAIAGRSTAAGVTVIQVNNNS